MCKGFSVGHKHAAILEQLRATIVGGELPPGSKLPTHDELKRRYAASRATIQGVIDELRDQGFVRSKGRAGTVVSDAPPHLCRYGFAVPQHPDTDPDGWPGFIVSLTSEAIALQDGRARMDIPIFYGLEEKGAGGQGKEGHDYAALSEQVAAHRLAGVIFAYAPFNLRGSPIMETPGIPRVTLMRDVEIPGTCVVFPDLASFIDKALDYLESRGRRRIGIVSVPETKVFMNYLAASIARRQLETRPYWTQIVSHRIGPGVLHTVELLMNKEHPCRPDGLVITDDNLVPHATAGLIAAGVSVPQEVDVVAHCNFPRPTPSMLEVKRLGFDARDVLKACIARIDEQRRGETPQPLTLIPAYFDDEIEAKRRDRA